VFPDPGTAEETIAEPPYSTYVNGLQPVAARAADQRAALVQDLRLQGFNLAAATAVLLMTAVAACVIHVRTQAQTIFARHLSGWTFAATHRRLLLVEVALAAGFVGWVAGSPSPHTHLDEDAVRAALLESDGRIQAEHLRARRAMNDEAGQSWRNLAG
jgi:hypothetical protein